MRAEAGRSTVRYDGHGGSCIARPISSISVTRKETKGGELPVELAKAAVIAHLTNYSSAGRAGGSCRPEIGGVPSDRLAPISENSLRATLRQ